MNEKREIERARKREFFWFPFDCSVCHRAKANVVYFMPYPGAMLTCPVEHIYHFGLSVTVGRTGRSHLDNMGNVFIMEEERNTQWSE